VFLLIGHLTSTQLLSRCYRAIRLRVRVGSLREPLEEDTQRHVERYRARDQGRHARLAFGFLNPRDCAPPELAGIGEGLLREPRTLPLAAEVIREGMPYLPGSPYRRRPALVSRSGRGVAVMRAAHAARLLRHLRAVGSSLRLIDGNLRGP
jgi:hypothetical protein